MSGVKVLVNVFIIGSKGIPAKYGGFETFVDKLVSYRKKDSIKYHVACLSDNEDEFEYNGARCFNVKIKDIGNAKAITYDVKALKMCEQYIKKNNLKNCIIYILACRIGPFLAMYKNRFEKQGIKICVNPDGHEWKRSKWNRFIKAYWKSSERLMVKHSDLLICDSKGIEDYIQEEYAQYNPKTTFIAYGADINKSILSDDDDKLTQWYNKFNIRKNEYYLVVGRFVPENNYEIMISEFVNSNSKKDLVIVTNVEENKFYGELVEKTNFINDDRIKFVGTVYDEELIKKIRENAYAYIHGHEVGGTNPSLLEALASTKINLLLDVNFNVEVAKEGALYFNKENMVLAGLIEDVDEITEERVNQLSINAKRRITDKYSWNRIVDKYEGLFAIDQGINYI